MSDQEGSDAEMAPELEADTDAAAVTPALAVQDTSTPAPSPGGGLFGRRASKAAAAKGAAEKPPQRRASGLFGNLVAGIQEQAAQGMKDYADTKEALATLSRDTQEALKDASKNGLVKAGRVIKALRTSDLGGGFTDPEIDMIIFAVYCSRADEELMDVFDMLYNKVIAETGECRVKLTLSCEKLYDLRKMELGPSNPQLIVFRRHDDPFAVKQFQEVVGYTEVKMDTRKPKFKTPVLLDYNPNVEQNIRIRVCNATSGESVATEKAIYDDWEHLGQFETSLNIISRAAGEVTGKLSVPERGVDTLTHTKQGVVKIKTEPVLELTAEHFRKVYPLMGEAALDGKHLDRLFTLVDEDGSGKIEFEEFKKLVLTINTDEEEDNDMWDVEFRRDVENTPYAISAMCNMVSGQILPELFDLLTAKEQPFIVDKFDMRLMRGSLSNLEATVVQTYNSRSWVDEVEGRLAQFEMDVDFFGEPEVLLRLETEGSFSKDMNVVVNKILIQAQMQITMAGLSRVQVAFLRPPKVEMETTVTEKSSSKAETELLEKFLVEQLYAYDLNQPYDINLRLHDVLGF